MKKTLLLLGLVLLISGCSNSAFKSIGGGSSVPELINEIHDLDTETTFLFNNYGDSCTKFEDLAAEVDGLESLKTVEQNAEKCKANGKMALVKFNELLSKINEVKKERLTVSQKEYVEKLELSSNSYIEHITLGESIIDQETKFAGYVAHNELFFDIYRDIAVLDSKASTLSKQNNWEATREELTLMNGAVLDAENEVKIMKEYIPFKFLNEYEVFILLIKQYVQKNIEIVDKVDAGNQVSQSEIDEAYNLGLKAGTFFEQDDQGGSWATGERDEIEAYVRENIESKSDASQEAFNKADAYYEDAKLKYEKLNKE